MPTIRDYFETLGLEPGADREQIKQAYRDLARVWHPDRFGEDHRLQKVAEEKLKQINEAYRALLDAAEAQTGGDRASRDRNRSRRPPPREPSPSAAPPPPSVSPPSRHGQRRRFPVYAMIAGGVAAGFLIPIAAVFLSRFEPSVGPQQDIATPLASDTTAPDSVPAPAVASDRRRPPALRETETDTPERRRGAFRIKATRDEVLVAMGPPDAVEGDVWWYGSDRVVFSNGRVVGFSNPSGSLRVVVERPTPGTPGVMIENADSAAAVEAEVERRERDREDDWWLPWE